MKREKDLKRYGKVFIEALAPYLKDKFGVSVDIYPTDSEGAIVKFNINDKNRKVTIHTIESNVGEALKNIQQNFVTGELGRVKFGGTSLYMDDTKVVVIKGENDQNTWSKRAAIDDVKRVLRSQMGTDNAK